MSLTSKVFIITVLWVWGERVTLQFQKCGEWHIAWNNSKGQQNKSELSASEIYVSKMSEPLYMFYES